MCIRAQKLLPGPEPYRDRGDVIWTEPSDIHLPCTISAIARTCYWTVRRSYLAGKERGSDLRALEERKERSVTADHKLVERVVLVSRGRHSNHPVDISVYARLLNKEGKSRPC
jgi:hypothetical protein